MTAGRRGTALPLVIAVSASPTWPNPGMASVDLALHGLFHRHGIAAELRFARLYGTAACRAALPLAWQRRLDRRERLAPLRYGALRPRLTGRGGRIAALLYWGDFFHSRDYMNRIAALLCQIGDAATPAVALADVQRHFFLRGAPAPLLANAMAFGGTLIFNRARDYLDPDYRASLEHFLRGARRVWMRDLYSADRAARLRARPAEPSALGVDAALLLRDEDLAALRRSAWRRRQAPAPPHRAGIFFGRSHTDATLAGRFAGRLCRRLGVAGEWLPWFDPGMLPNHLVACRAGFPGLAVDARHAPTCGDLLARIATYACVISDTYHVCVNAWRAGVPALCVGAATPDPRGFDVSTGWFGAWRDKRHTFYAMHDAMEYYVFGEELSHRTGLANRVLQAADLLADRELARAIAADMRRRAGAAEADLVAELRRVAGGPG